MEENHYKRNGIDNDLLEESTYFPFSQKQIADLIGVPKQLISCRHRGNGYVGNWCSAGLREQIAKYDYWELFEADEEFRQEEYVRHPPLKSLIEKLAKEHGIVI